MVLTGFNDRLLKLLQNSILNSNMISEKSSQSNLKDVKYIVAIAAGKGGVGKSSVAVNLALALAQMGHQVGVLDADIYGPSVRQMLPLESAPRQNSLHAERIVPASSLGLKMISMAYFHEEAAVVRAPIANGIITQFLTLVDWGSLDYLLIDFPPGTGDIQLTLMQQGSLSGAVMVTTPQEVALLDVNKSMQMFEQLQIPLIGLIENMSYFQDPTTHQHHYPFGKDGGSRLASQFGIPLLGKIPLDPQISQCGDQSKSLFEKSPPCPAAIVFLQIAELLKQHLFSLGESEGSYLRNFELIWQRNA